YGLNRLRSSHAKYDGLRRGDDFGEWSDSFLNDEPCELQPRHPRHLRSLRRILVRLLPRTQGARAPRLPVFLPKQTDVARNRRISDREYQYGLYLIPLLPAVTLSKRNIHNCRWARNPPASFLQSKASKHS